MNEFNQDYKYGRPVESFKWPFHYVDAWFELKWNKLYYLSSYHIKLITDKLLIVYIKLWRNLPHTGHLIIKNYLIIKIIIIMRLEVGIRRMLINKAVGVLQASEWSERLRGLCQWLPRSFQRLRWTHSWPALAWNRNLCQKCVEVGMKMTIKIIHF